MITERVQRANVKRGKLLMIAWKFKETISKIYPCKKKINNNNNNKKKRSPPMILSSARISRRCLDEIFLPLWFLPLLFQPRVHPTIRATDPCRCPTGCTHVPANNSRQALHKARAPTHGWTCRGRLPCE